MLISDEKHFIFVHIYKTAGSSITRLLGPYVDARYRAAAERVEGDGWQETWHYRGQQHDKLDALRADPLWTDRDLSEYRICTVVRNPYTWALSVWNDFYRQESSGPLWFSTLYPSRGFRDYCRFVKAASMGMNKNIWGCSSQLSFIDDRELKPTFVARFERLQEDIAALLQLLDIPSQDVPHEIWSNPDERSDALAFYDDECLSIVNEVFAADFHAFGYEMLDRSGQSNSPRRYAGK